MADKVALGILLDESGSMAENRQSVISGTNKFLQGLKEEESDVPVDVSIVKFGGTRRVLIRQGDLDSISLLTNADYLPSGSTPLNDATIELLDSLEKLVDHRKLVVIFTDGKNNASETPTAIVRQRIDELDGNGWTFIYMGANHDVWAESSKLGLGRVGQTFSYDSTPTGTMSAMASVSSLAKTYRNAPAQYENKARSMNTHIGDDGPESSIGAGLVSPPDEALINKYIDAKEAIETASKVVK